MFADQVVVQDLLRRELSCVFVNIGSADKPTCQEFDRKLANLARELKSFFGDRIGTVFIPTVESYKIVFSGSFDDFELARMVLVLEGSDLLVDSKNNRLKFP